MCLAAYSLYALITALKGVDCGDCHNPAHFSACDGFHRQTFRKSEVNAASINALSDLKSLKVSHNLVARRAIFLL